MDENGEVLTGKLAACDVLECKRSKSGGVGFAVCYSLQRT
jgi:hypothetical protein